MINTGTNAVPGNMLNKRNVKLLFSLISILLLIPPMLAHDIYYYSTLFVFLSGEMVDLLAFSSVAENSYFFLWQTANRWGSILTCAFAFCLLLPMFHELFESSIGMVNGLLLMFPVSCFLQEGVSSVLEDIRIRTFNEYNAE